MKITKIEAKTFYNVRLSYEEIDNAFTNYQNTTKKHVYPRAFSGVDIMTKDLFTEIGLWGNNDTYTFLANYFGFDGWSNAGYYNEKTEEYCAQYYKWGVIV